MMIKCIWLYSLAAAFSGASWWAFVLGQTTAPRNAVSWVEIIQLGGTGGLILSLLGATITLWRERSELKKEFKQEREHLIALIDRTRDDHKEYLERLQNRHSEEVTALHQKYTAELKAQIDLLKNQTQHKFEEERRRSDKEYGQQ